jgi:hypothetical protein
MKAHTLKQLQLACKAAVERADKGAVQRRHDDRSMFRPYLVQELDAAVLKLAEVIEHNPQYRQTGLMR